MAQSIEQLLQSGYITEVGERPYCTNGEKLQQVLDMRHVNKYLIVTKFRHENIRDARDIIEENDYFSTFDRKSGLHGTLPLNKIFCFRRFAVWFSYSRVRVFKSHEIIYGKMASRRKTDVPLL